MKSILTTLLFLLSTIASAGETFKFKALPDFTKEVVFSGDLNFLTDDDFDKLRLSSCEAYLKERRQCGSPHFFYRGVRIRR